jgi:threonine dehydrogenase-like Zn-dependent dehydrogenase
MLERKSAIAAWHMVLNQTSSDGQNTYPVVLGAGLTGLAISLALSAAGIKHVLIGDRPTEIPRLGESLNAEGEVYRNSRHIVREPRALCCRGRKGK